MKNRILIIAVTFPPAPSVGGRRWAKFAKYLKRSGSEVFVLSAEPPKGVSSPWDKDIMGINVTRVRLFHPLHYKHKSILIRRVIFKIGQWLLPLICKGNIHDKTILSKKKILRAASQIIINQKIDTLIVTGAPFRSLWYGSLLKNRFPFLKFLVDLRDPWSWGLRSYGYNNLSSRRRMYEKQLEQEVVTKADTVLVTVDPMLEKLCQLYPSQQAKILLLPHGYDVEDIVENKKVADPERIKLIYFGTLYGKLDEHFNGIAKAFSLHPNRFTLDIYSSDKKYKDIFTKYGVASMVKYNNIVPAKSLFEKVAKMNYALMFKLTNYGNDNISTKYYELIASKTPILLIGPKGKASDLISQNSLGFHFSTEKIEECFSNLAKRKLDLQYNKQFVSNHYDYKNLTVMLKNLIQDNDLSSFNLANNEKLPGVKDN